jgi:gluconate kinase
VVIDKAHSTDDALNCSALAEIQRKIIKKGKQNAVSRFIHSKGDKEAIAGWKSKLSKILLVFNVRSVVVV